MLFFKQRLLVGLAVGCVGAILYAALAYRLYYSAVGRAILLPTLAYRLHHSGVGQVSSDDEMYEVYSATIRDLLKGDDESKSPDDLGARLVVVEDHTISYPSEKEDDPIKRALWWSISGVIFDGRTIEDYNRKRKDSISLEALFTLPGNQVLISDQQLEQFFGHNGSRSWWQGFYKSYPNSEGYVSVSRVGFNPDHDQAFLYAGVSCGGLCGAGYYVLLTKNGGAWSVKYKDELWVS